MLKRLREIIKIFALPFLLLIIHLIMDFYGVYIKFEWLDLPMHLLGGALVSYSYYRLLKTMQKYEYVGFIHSVFLFIFIISFVALIAVFWELYEFTLDSIDFGTRQTHIRDTMIDLSLDLVGGIFGYFCSKFLYTIK